MINREKVSIRNLYRNNDGCWIWNVFIDDKKEGFFCTDENGRGLYVISDDGNEKQIDGSCQFIIPSNNTKSAYDYIRKYFSKSEVWKTWDGEVVGR